MKLTVLGTSAAYPGPNTPCSGYLVQDGASNILLDCGSGAIGNLQVHLGLRDVSDIFISHMHADHFFDLIPYRYALRYGIDGTGHLVPRLHLPPGGINVLNQVVAPFSESGNFFSEVFDVSEFDPQAGLSLGGMAVRFLPVKHYIPTYALSFTGSKKLAYSSDSGACPELRAIAQNADLLLCTVGRCLGPDIADLWGHLLPGEAGQIARESGARQLLLTHLWPTCDRAIVAREASSTYGRPVEVAELNRIYAF